MVFGEDHPLRVLICTLKNALRSQNWDFDWESDVLRGRCMKNPLLREDAYYGGAVGIFEVQDVHFVATDLF